MTLLTVFCQSIGPNVLRETRGSSWHVCPLVPHHHVRAWRLPPRCCSMLSSSSRPTYGARGSAA